MKNPVSAERHRELENFLYTEARLLEDCRFEEWLACFAIDVRYWMPVRQSVQGQDPAAPAADTFALFDDDRKSLEMRILRIRTGRAHAEVPASVTQRFVTNVMAQAMEGAGAAQPAFSVRSNFQVFQERRGLHDVCFYGRREDVIRQGGSGLEIAYRKIELAQTILPTTLSIFF